ncbi:protein YpjP [Oceanobacillus picturae]|uniref:Protein YpjP n=1 Tax=Oceanobacillus picturae TaxID=171693 RepID=A0A0U9H690_9BACI|nr:YpjP family protein [Oceanobacillus picturae]GAQ18247.1 protein YpjP [Oceanobacillus picturae]
MKLWLRKAAVVLITIMTLGMYVPPAFLNADESKDDISAKTDIKEDISTSVAEADSPLEEESQEDKSVSFVQSMTSDAKVQTMKKLGPKISSQIDPVFLDTILFGVEEAVTKTLATVDESDYPFIGITDQPTDGWGEKIFNLYDVRTDKALAKFHVRRDNRPMEGYWFNFHYHVSNDRFETHREIGEIFWSKNVPPKWMA